MLAYFPIIQKHFFQSGEAYRIYVVHVTLVTRLAIKIARRQGLSSDSLTFIEEAGMLHDIGIAYTNSPELGCHGPHPYLMHLIEGRRVLLAEGLPKHARVAANHVGVGGLSAQQIVESGLPLPAEDILCESIEEKIISYADIWYSKKPKNLWKKKSYEELCKKLEKRPESLKLFKKWHKEFGE